MNSDSKNLKEPVMLYYSPTGSLLVPLLDWANHRHNMDFI